LDDRPIIATVVNAIKDQQKQIDQLKTEIDALKEQNELLKKTLSKIDLSSMKAAVGEKL
jgi:cell division protein FtsB